MNKYEAGYNLLLILSVSDGEYLPEEGQVIADYLRAQHEPFIGTAEENSLLLELSDEQLLDHFKDSALKYHSEADESQKEELFTAATESFFADSSPEERNQLLRFVMRLVKADNVVSPGESSFLSRLYDAWGID